MTALDHSSFQFLATLIKKNTGIHLTEDKYYLLESRLLPVAHKLHMKDLFELIDYVKKNNSNVAITYITEAITTNESSFFRDTKPFEYLKSLVIPHLQDTNPSLSTLKIWSAACSTGQEPYSIAITFKDSPALKHLQAKILATDIDSTVLQKTIDGIYTQFEVQRGLPINILMKYFNQHNQCWHIKDELKSMITTQQCNLVEGLKTPGTFDIVFCRNVLIYFDTETKRKVLENIASKMLPHSVLFLGSTENVLGYGEDLFSPFKQLNGLYELKK